jgi:hypothetical protein
MKETKIANTTNWIQHLEFLILMVTMIGGIYSLDAKIERQSQRTDRLYEMFIDLVKEKK